MVAAATTTMVVRLPLSSPPSLPPSCSNMPRPSGPGWRAVAGGGGAKKWLLGLSFGKSESLKGNYTRKATDNGVGGDRAVSRREGAGREGRSERASDAQCIAPSCFTRKAGIRAKGGGRQAGRNTGRKVGP